MKAETQRSTWMMVTMMLSSSFYPTSTLAFSLPGRAAAPSRAAHGVSLRLSSSDDGDGMGSVRFSTGTSYGDWASLRPPPLESPPEADVSDASPVDPPTGPPLSPSASVSPSHVRFQRDDVGMMLNEQGMGRSGGGGLDGPSSSLTRPKVLRFVSDGGMMFEEPKPAHILKRAKISDESSDPMWMKAPTKTLAKPASVEAAVSSSSVLTSSDDSSSSSSNRDPLMLWDHQTPPPSDDLWRQAYKQQQTVEIAAIVDENTVSLKPRQPTLLWEQRESDFLPKY